LTRVVYQFLFIPPAGPNSQTRFRIDCTHCFQQANAATHKVPTLNTNARINFAGRGFLGFASQTVTDVTGGFETLTTYRQEHRGYAPGQ
jgi:hypothetical protein